MDYGYGYQLVPGIVPTVFFAVCTAVSLGASWLVVPRMTSKRVHPVIYALLAVSVVAGVLVNQVLVFASPMYAEKALVYYLVLALAGFLVVAVQVAWKRGGCWMACWARWRSGRARQAGSRWHCRTNCGADRVATGWRAG